MIEIGMEKGTNSLFGDLVRRYFLPFKNKWLNTSLYISVGLLGSAAAINDNYNYERDLQRFSIRYINKKPERHDYTAVGHLEKFLFNNDDGCFFLKKIDIKN